MAFPTTSVLEGFLGADNTSPPNSSWTNGVFNYGSGDGIRIFSNQARKNVGTSNSQDAQTIHSLLKLRSRLRL